MFQPRAVTVRSKQLQRSAGSSSVASGLTLGRAADSLLPETTNLTMPTSKPNVCIETSLGTIVFELYWNEAPKTCHNFHKLAADGYYDGIVFHRIISVGNSVFRF